MLFKSGDRERERDRDRQRDLPRGDRPGDERRERPTDRDRHGGRGNGTDGSSRMPGSKAVQRARSHLAELTGTGAERLSALTRTRDGWRVVLETVELERIPRTTDIMASYAIDLDSRGELLGYQRIGRYYRCDVSGEQ
jgi:hypothetical protein